MTQQLNPQAYDIVFTNPEAQEMYMNLMVEMQQFLGQNWASARRDRDKRRVVAHLKKRMVDILSITMLEDPEFLDRPHFPKKQKTRDLSYYEEMFQKNRDSFADKD